MDTIRQIFESYFVGNPVFLALHLAVAGVAVSLALQFRRTFGSLRRRADSVPKMSAEEIERITFTLTKFDHQFDLCASVFIFIGLIGTIAGFAQSLSKKSGEFDLAALAHALSTSAFGIVWSISLNVWYSRQQSARVAPWLERLRDRVAKADPIQELRDAAGLIKQEMAEEFRALQRQAIETFRQTLDAYSGATERLSGAAGTMSQAAQAAAAQYYAVNNEIAESTRRLDSLITRCTGLPEQLASQLDKTWGKADINLGKTLNAFRSELNKLEETLAAERHALASLFEEQSRGIEQIGAQSVQASAQAQQQLIDGVEKLGARIGAVADEIGKAPAGILGQVDAIVQTYGQMLEMKHEATAKHVERLGERFAAHLDQPLAAAGEKIEELLNKAQKLYAKLVADERKAFRESSDEARREFHQATVEQISQYRQMVAKIPSGIKAMQVENTEALHKVVAALDECVSALQRHAAADASRGHPTVADTPVDGAHLRSAGSTTASEGVLVSQDDASAAVPESKRLTAKSPSPIPDPANGASSWPLGSPASAASGPVAETTPKGGL